jgi:hypothetical protein
LRIGRFKSSKINFTLLIAVSLMSLVTFTCLHLYARADSTKAYVFMTPSLQIAREIGEVFNIAVNISSFGNVRSASFIITYNASLLSAEEVVQGTFFPSPPRSYFEYEENAVLGFLTVNISLSSTESSRSGNGSLVWVSLKALQSFKSCSGSPIRLEQILVLDSAYNPINVDSVGSVYFWESMQPDPPLGGRVLDVYTQKDGAGINSPGGIFAIGETVYLISVISYNGYPVQYKLVAYEVLTPSNQTILVAVTATDEAGRAKISFRIPSLPSSNGTWSVISVADIAEVLVWDTLTFEVRFTPPAVGGLSIPIPKYTAEMPATMYLPFGIIFLVVLAVCSAGVYVGAKRRRTRHTCVRSR